MTSCLRSHAGRRAARGLTLIELLVVLAIVGVLAAIAYPSYQEQLRKGRRAAAKSALMEAAQFMERNMSLNNCYHRNTPANCLSGSGAQTVLPSFAILPADGSAMYEVSFADPAPTASTYRLQAVPRTGTAQAGDACGAFTLDNLGVRGVTGSAGAASCWNR